MTFEDLKSNCKADFPFKIYWACCQKKKKSCLKILSTPFFSFFYNINRWWTYYDQTGSLFGDVTKTHIHTHTHASTHSTQMAKLTHRLLASKVLSPQNTVHAKCSVKNPTLARYLKLFYAMISNATWQRRRENTASRLTLAFCSYIWMSGLSAY